MFKPRGPSKADFEQANYLIKTSGLEAERQEKLKREELERKELERKKQHFSAIRESEFRPLSKKDIERKNAEKLEEENDRRLGIVRGPAVIPSFESLSRAVVKKHYNYEDLPEDDPQRIIIEADEQEHYPNIVISGGKSRRHKRSRKSKRHKRSRKTKRNRSRKTKRNRSSSRK